MGPTMLIDEAQDHSGDGVQTPGDGARAPAPPPGYRPGWGL